MSPEQQERVVDALSLGATLPEAAGSSRVSLRVVRDFFERGKLDRDRGDDTAAARFHEDAWRARALWRMTVRSDALAAAQAGRRVSGDLTRLLERDDSDLEVAAAELSPAERNMESMRACFDRRMREDPQFKEVADRYLAAANDLLLHVAGSTS
jgi:hypothetical protein